MTTITVTRPDPVATPRGAEWAAEIAARVLDWAHIPAHPQVADDAESQRQAEAAEVRRLAATMESEDHRCAADLNAAADRHERA